MPTKEELLAMIQDPEAAIMLADFVLEMDMVTPKGIAVRQLARRVLGLRDLGHYQGLVPVCTNGTLRMIPKSEPIFLLRGQDKYGAQAVRFWAGLVAGEAGHLSLIAQTALNHADKMEAWPVKKTPNLPYKSEVPHD